MVMRLNKVIPFGRSLGECKCMFNLSQADLDKKIIGVGDGPASFNAEMKKMGNSIVLIDPLYEFNADEIDNQFYNPTVKKVKYEIRKGGNEMLKITKT